MWVNCGDFSQFLFRNIAYFSKYLKWYGIPGGPFQGLIFLDASSEGSHEIAHKRRLVWALRWCHIVCTILLSSNWFGVYIGHAPCTVTYNSSLRFNFYFFSMVKWFQTSQYYRSLMSIFNEFSVYFNFAFWWVILTSWIWIILLVFKESFTILIELNLAGLN